MSEKRIFYLDYLKSLCSFLVIVLHMASQNWGICNIDSYSWNVFNIYNSVTRFTVPIFIMASGVLFLDYNRELDIYKLFRKSILRLLIVYFSWSLIYAIYAYRDGWRGIKNFVVDILNGYYHMWFIPMIIGLYILVPILRKIVIDLKIMAYTLSLLFCISFVVPLLYKIPILFKMQHFYENMGLNFDMTYILYFILGYFLTKIDSKKYIRVISVSGFLGILCTIFISKFMSKAKAEAVGYYGNDTIPVLVTSIAVFLMVKYLCEDGYVKGKWKQLIEITSSYSLGIYLVHPLWISILKDIGINTLLFNPAVSVAVISGIVYALSFITIEVIKKIPIMKHLIV